MLFRSLEMPAIEFLENHYGIERYPSVVVGDNVKSGFQSIDEIEAELNVSEDRS